MRDHIVGRLAQRLAMVGAGLFITGCSRSATQSAAPTEGTFAQVTAPNAPTIWVHYDYMVASDHSHAPQPTTLDSLVSAFRRRGITLVIDPRPAALPESRFVVFDGHVVHCPQVGGDATAANFYELKAQYFHPQGARAWHYVLFGHFGDPDGNRGCLSTGIATLGGYDFVVTLGEFFEPELFCQGCSPEESRQFQLMLPRFEGGVTLHELGHNLCLNHGGACSDAVNYKPNYISVMNYIYASGIQYAAVPASIVPAGYRLDYSDRGLPALDERHLDERVGVQAGTTDIVSYLCLPATRTDPTEIEARSGPAAGPIDWNCDGAIEGDVAQDIDVNSECAYPSYPCYSVLTGFNDWAWIQQWLRTPEYLAGTVRSRGLVR